MITRIEIDGFKTFQDFAVDLVPFQVIIGPNGCGKSNLFDAIHLFSHLADSNLNTAFQKVRGEAHDLFTILPDGTSVDRMRLAVEMLVERVVRDDWGSQAELEFPRLRYELHIARTTDDNGLERLQINHEFLSSISPDQDVWLDQYTSLVAKMNIKKGHPKYFIYPNKDELGMTLIGIENTYEVVRKPLHSTTHMDINRTTLSRAESADYFPHAMAVRKEMQSWRYLHPHPAALRLPSSTLADPYLTAEGGNLPATLARMEAEDPALLHDVGRDLGNLVSDVCRIEIDKDVARNSYSILAKTRDGRRIPARLLSDGTLRMLALATLRNDPERQGVLCLEEPENSVHPAPLERLVRLLRNMTTDLSDTEQTNEPLRQLLVSTHSPELVGQLDLLKGELLYAEMVTRIEPGKQPVHVTRMTPVRPDAADGPERSYPIARVIEFLKYADIGKLRANLRKELIR